MTPAALSLLADLRAAGMEVSPSNLPGKVHVQPLAALTPARRQAILTNKAELLAALALESRIRAMGSRWGYTDADVAEALQCAAADPATWLRAVQWDEELHRVAPDPWAETDQQFYGSQP